MDFVSGLTNLLLIGSALANAVIGAAVFSRNPRAKLNQYFFILCLGICGWAITNVIFQIVNDSIAYPMALLSYACAMIVGVGFLLFSQALTGIAVRGKRTLVWLGASMAAVAAVPGVVATGVFDAQIRTNHLMLGVYASVLVLLLGEGLILLVRGLRSAQDATKARLHIVFVGLCAAIFVGVLCNLVLPLYGNYTLVAVGPSGSLFFVGMTAYAIARHHLFDIRFFVVRALAYGATLAVLASLFGVIVLGVARLFFNLQLSFWAEVYLSAATALAALAFSGLKSFFDKVTNQLFYRDAYDSQALFDQLNRLFVSNAELVPLLRRSSEVLKDSFKAEFCYFAIRESEHASQRIIGHAPRLPRTEDTEVVRSMTPRLRRKIIVADELEGPVQPLRETLRANHIAVLGRLSSGTAVSSEGLGYLVLGARRSGNPYTAKDVHTLETIVNELVIAIENSLRFEQIQHFNETLQENVSEATRKLRKTNEKLQGLDATKDEFITMASHQLRTPLTAVKGYLSMVLEGDAGKLNANQRRLLEQSYTSSQRMVYLISDLLNLSRLGTGKFVIESTPTNLIDVVQSELDQLAQTAASRDVHLVFNYPENFPELMLDETKIHQVVMNFIDNAIYYTPAGGEVTVSLIETPGNVQYIVEDTGIGVPRKEQRHLFTKFFRAENARQARPDGTGLGLFMAKKVVAAQGGAIIFESEEGKGSKFGFRFSKASHAVRPSEPAQA